MQILLQDVELQQIQGLLDVMPFKHAIPLFQYLTKIATEQVAKENTKVDLPKTTE